MHLSQYILIQLKDCQIWGSIHHKINIKFKIILNNATNNETGVRINS